MSNEICEAFVNPLCFGIEHKLIELKTSTELAPTHPHKLAKLRIPTIWFLIYRFHGLLILILLTLTLGTHIPSRLQIYLAYIQRYTHEFFFRFIYLWINSKKKAPQMVVTFCEFLSPHILFWWLCFFLIIIYFEFCPLLPILLNVISHILCGVLCRWWHS
jgi:hypothetical protein